MTEAEWLECTDPQMMLDFLRGKASERKLRLFAVACCRHVWRLFQGENRNRAAVLVSERFADGLANKQDLRTARKRARHCEVATTRLNAYEAAGETSSAAAYEVRLLAIDCGREEAILAGYTTHTPASDQLWQQESRDQCAIIHDLFGNLHRSVTPDPTWLTWRGSLIPRLAQAAYEERRLPSGHLDNARLAVLADALEEAGCTVPEILDHLRDPGPHYRGCHILDLLLGKS